jgi:hypothetical protein
MTSAAKLIKKIKALPENRLGEVENFVDSIQTHLTSRGVTMDYAQASLTAFQGVWDNESDAVYDSL